MDHSEMNPTSDRWSNGGGPATDVAMPPGAETETGAGDVAVTPSSVTSGFLAELAKAMHAAADQERERIATVIADDAAAHVVRAKARASVEAEELRRFADEDLKQINEWSAAEIRRIRSEATRRADERRAALAEYIHQHEAIIDTEIQGVDAAMAAYRVTLQQFFTELTTSTDPAEIVRRAGTLPPPPDLDDVRANARAEAVALLAQTTASDDAAALPGASDAADSPGPSDAGSSDPGSSDTAPSDGETPLVGVMDPGASRQAGTLDVLAEVDAGVEDAGEAAEDAPVDETAADGNDAYPQPVAAVAGSPAEPGTASRLLRMIVSWAGPSDHIERRAP